MLLVQNQFFRRCSQYKGGLEPGGERTRLSQNNSCSMKLRCGFKRKKKKRHSDELEP